MTQTDIDLKQGVDELAEWEMECPQKTQCGMCLVPCECEGAGKVAVLPMLRKDCHNAPPYTNCVCEGKTWLPDYSPTNLYALWEKVKTLKWTWVHNNGYITLCVPKERGMIIVDSKTGDIWADVILALLQAKRAMENKHHPC